jgi:hypothetical protein
VAVIDAAELWEGRGGEDDFQRHRTYRRVFQLRTSDPADGPTVAGGHPFLPRLGESHPEDFSAVVVKVSPEQQSEDPRLWRVTIEYDTQPSVPAAQQPTDADSGSEAPEEEKPGDKPENPTERLPEWKVTFEKTAEPRRYSQNATDPTTFDNPILNSAKLPFDPPVMVEVARPVVAVTFNLPRFSLVKAQNLVDTVNKTTWRGLAPRVARLSGIEAGTEAENGITFWKVTYTFSIKWDTWDLRVLDCGYAEYQPADPGHGHPATWVKIRDPFGSEATEPVPLDGGGRRLTPGQPPVYLAFKVYRELDFNTALA